MQRLVQLQRGGDRRVALVEEPRLRLLLDFESVYALVWAALEQGADLAGFVRGRLGDATLEYEPIYRGEAEWRLLVPLDHPGEPARVLVSGTGLTHLGSARNRQSMHATAEEAATDSMRMFRAGLEGGRPKPGQIGVSPEWFYKGSGLTLRAHGEALDVPGHALDGGEEAEIAGLYIIGPDGQPRRVGMTAGNEFSDHRFEKTNYLNLAGSKLRTCAIGLELVIGPAFDSVPGEVSIRRGDKTVWAKTIRTGESEMCHSLANIEHHHFKFDGHRRPGDVHVHYFGAASVSFGDGIDLIDGDMIVIRFEGFGRALCNRVQVLPPLAEPLQAAAL